MAARAHSRYFMELLSQKMYSNFSKSYTHMGHQGCSMMNIQNDNHMYAHVRADMMDSRYMGNRYNFFIICPLLKGGLLYRPIPSSGKPRNRIPGIREKAPY